MITLFSNIYILVILPEIFHPNLLLLILWRALMTLNFRFFLVQWFYQLTLFQYFFPSLYSLQGFMKINLALNLLIFLLNLIITLISTEFFNFSAKESLFYLTLYWGSLLIIWMSMLVYLSQLCMTIRSLNYFLLLNCMVKFLFIDAFRQL